MSKLTELLDELCPDGVEYRPLGEVGEFLRGSSLQKKHLTSEGVPCIHYGQVYTRYGLSANETYSFLKPEFATGMRTMTTGDLFIATTSENEEDLGKAVAWLGQKEVVASNDAFIYRHNLDPMYVSYFFASSHFHDQKYRFITGTKVKRLSGDSMAKIIIPVPPLEVQQEIVRVLDAFTDLEQSLVSELELRKKQFSQVRSSLTSPEGREMVPLGAISKNLDSRRIPITQRDRISGGIPYYGASGIVDYVADYIFDGDYLLISEDGANLKARVSPIAFSISGKTWVNNHAHVLEFETYSERRFVEHYINQSDISAFVSGGAQPKLNQKNLSALPVPVYSMSEKESVVSNLDAFDSLIQSIEQEISLRRKQYEFYRDELLSFTPKKD